MEETQRQKKIAGVIQKDMADVLQRAATDGGLKGLLISVSKVSVTTDLSIAKVYLSIFPSEKIIREQYPNDNDKPLFWLYSVRMLGLVKNRVVVK